MKNKILSIFLIFGLFSGAGYADGDVKEEKTIERYFGKYTIDTVIEKTDPTILSLKEIDDYKSSEFLISEKMFSVHGNTLGNPIYKIRTEIPQPIGKKEPQNFSSSYYQKIKVRRELIIYITVYDGDKVFSSFEVTDDGYAIYQTSDKIFILKK